MKGTGTAKRGQAILILAAILQVDFLALAARRHFLAIAIIQTITGRHCVLKKSTQGWQMKINWLLG
jgi:hypothetical protein